MLRELDAFHFAMVHQKNLAPTNLDDRSQHHAGPSVSNKGALETCP